MKEERELAELKDRGGGGDQEQHSKGQRQEVFKNVVEELKSGWSLEHRWGEGGAGRAQSLNVSGDPLCWVVWDNPSVCPLFWPDY